MHLGEPVAHDNPKLCSMRKAIKSHTVATFHDDPSHVSFQLPMHKTDRLYEGSTIEIEQRQSNLDTLAIFHRYLSPRDHLQKWHPLLWLRESRVSPTRSWYIQCLRAHFPGGFAGRSLRSGGATALALANVPTDRIRLAGRWSSHTFIRKNSVTSRCRYQRKYQLEGPRK
jgi:hypothetical protein